MNRHGPVVACLLTVVGVMPRRFAVALFVSLAGMVSAVLATQQPSTSVPPAAAIRLRAATFSPTRGEAPPVAANQLTGPTRAGQRGEFLVQFQGPVQESWKGALVSAGVDLLEYVPDFAFRVRASAEVATRLRQLPFVAWVGPYHPAYKLATPSGGAEDQPYIIRLERDADAAAVESTLGASGMRVTRRGTSLLTVIALPAQLAALAETAGIASIEPFALRVKHNEFGGGVILGSRIANDSGYDGSSQILAVADTGLGGGTALRGARRHPGRRACVRSSTGRARRTLVSRRSSTTARPTWTPATARTWPRRPSAPATRSGIGRGTAPAARPRVPGHRELRGPVPRSAACSTGCPTATTWSGSRAISVTSSSRPTAPARECTPIRGGATWPAPTPPTARTPTPSCGRIATWRSPSRPGNSGVDANGDGVVDPASIGSPATAKNVITVGASENDRQSHWECDTGLAYTGCAAQGGQNAIFTYGATWPDSLPGRIRCGTTRARATPSRWPRSAAAARRHDGRIKPDVVAPGTWNLSGYSAASTSSSTTRRRIRRTAAYQYDGWGYPR